MSCQTPHAQIMLSLSQLPEPQVPQEPSQGVPERGRVDGHPAAAGGVQVKAAFPAWHWQIPSR
jgi:hypothetical protein